MQRTIEKGEGGHVLDLDVGAAVQAVGAGGAPAAHPVPALPLLCARAAALRAAAARARAAPRAGRVSRRVKVREVARVQRVPQPRPQRRRQALRLLQAQPHAWAFWNGRHARCQLRTWPGNVPRCTAWPSETCSDVSDPTSRMIS